MFCMGMTLDFSDFKNTLKKPRSFLTAILLQFTIMPMTAFVLVKLLQLISISAIKGRNNTNFENE